MGRYSTIQTNITARGRRFKETTKYPVQDVCLSAYFEIDDSALCFCFHNAHAGVIANLIFQGQEDMPSLEEVTPAVLRIEIPSSDNKLAALAVMFRWIAATPCS